ncbi:chitinase [Trametes meyenii]|nr:chitinase [Trametes meyenii]
MLSFFYFILFVVAPLAQGKPHNRLRRTCSPGKAAGGPKSSLVSSGWYAGYHSSDFPLQKVSWNKYTHLTYSFATTSPEPTEVNLDDSDVQLLPQFVQEAHKNNVKALVSVGGWGGSKHFSSNVGSASSRNSFVNTITDLATKFDLDGIDFDWEYPSNKNGLECNVNSASDTANFLSFLQELRSHPVGKNLTLTAATSVKPWNGPDESTPLSDVSGFAKVLDWIEIMNYDVWGTWVVGEGVGPNAPLNDTCAPAAKQMGSAVSAVAAWTAAGIPASQIVLGVPAYGHSFRVAKTDALSKGSLNSFPQFDSNDVPAGDSWDDAAGTDDGCGEITTKPGGDITFWGLIQQKYLTAEGTVTPGMDYRFDECSQTPYVYNKQTNVMVSFDDARSFAAKGAFIKAQRLRGFAMWEAGGDSGDILLDSIRAASGFKN